MNQIVQAALGLIAVETLKPSSPDFNFATPADFADQERRAGQMPIAARSRSQLARYQIPTVQTGVAPLGWLPSTRNLDFCLLALCSCLLAILCHQVVILPGSGTAHRSIASTASMSRSAQLDFLLKAGLFTGRSQPEVETEEEI